MSNNTAYKLYKKDIESELKKLKKWVSTNNTEILENFPDELNKPDKLKEVIVNSPKKENIFNALKIIEPENVKVIILGQDPYPNIDIADGFAFSFLNPQEPPTNSLENIFYAIKKYKNTASEPKEWNSNLKNWAEHNKILLLNTSLTYNAETNTHFDVWKPFIKNVISNLLINKIESEQKLAVFLWGTRAQDIFFQSVNEMLQNKKNYEKKIRKENIKQLLYKNKIKFKKISSVAREEEGIELVPGIRIYMTSHPSPISENNNGKFVDFSIKHFKDCDKFLFGNEEQKYIWKNFPENNK